ncbi:hypothetical protein ACSSS7_002456 [Eimeria intestinalis]
MKAQVVRRLLRSSLLLRCPPLLRSTAAASGAAATAALSWCFNRPLLPQQQQPAGAAFKRYCKQAADARFVTSSLGPAYASDMAIFTHQLQQQLLQQQQQQQHQQLQWQWRQHGLVLRKAYQTESAVVEQQCLRGPRTASMMHLL